MQAGICSAPGRVLSRIMENEIMKDNMLRIGLDVGSTTAKIAVVDRDGNMVYGRYKRHNADIRGTVLDFFNDISERFAGSGVCVKITGSAGMGVSERYGFPFIQEVLALNDYSRKKCTGLKTIIDIGGEDAKIIFINGDTIPDMRMNGNCAGGTGAFIDQMSVILGMSIEEMDAAAASSTRIYPIASRCGVFSKTDIQNLVAKNADRGDICASIFHAIAVQVVASLSRGRSIEPKVLFCGGPLAFIKSLRQAFKKYLGLGDGDIEEASDANMLTAFGCALSIKPETGALCEASRLSEMLDVKGHEQVSAAVPALKPIFSGREELEAWRLRKSQAGNLRGELKNEDILFLGIDSGSTTTKIVFSDCEGKIVFSHYSKNMGNPVGAVRKGLGEFLNAVKEKGFKYHIISGCSTGYGEDLVKAAFGLNLSMVETMAHYTAAKKICPDVDFILDIGGQDMKAMFIKNGVLNRIELNEACSSGCGSFIETFANSLGFTASEFAEKAVLAVSPCDLGTRCTVFMNSKIKQAMREGADVADIAAGLAYSVVKNCFYKVLKIRDDSIGSNIVVQGGTMRNDAVVKALENIVGHEVFRNSMPELMGAYGCALYALEQYRNGVCAENGIDIEKEISFRLSHTSCKGCENNCYIDVYDFENGSKYYSGNKCEKIFTFRSKGFKGDDIYSYRRKRVFEAPEVPSAALALGVPRVLNLFEDYPFWASLFASFNIRLVPSDASVYSSYERHLREVMSDNICFPAKLVHSHIHNLEGKGVDRIFFPYVIYESKEDRSEANSYNCPIVSGYNTIIRNIRNDGGIPFDNPVFTLKDRKLTVKNALKYLSGLHEWAETAGKRFVRPDRKNVAEAVEKAFMALDRFHADMQAKNREYFDKAKSEGRLVILLAGRPYHTDSLIQHKLSDIISDLGATVINEEILSEKDDFDMRDTFILSQWNYINKIIKAAKWTGLQGNDVNYVQMTSFGCGPDAFLLDEVSHMLERYGKPATIVKIDDINNVGSMKLRIRSLIESLKYRAGMAPQAAPFVSTKRFEKEDKKNRKLLAPFFTEYLSPFLPELFAISGYDLVALPMSDRESADYGLKYANNEVCYPATLIVGDMIKALKSGKYDPKECAAGITQTGGQCRASNYFPIIKKALVDAGFADVPVVSVSFGSAISNDQPGFGIDWVKTIPAVANAVIFGDNLSALYHATIVRAEDKQKVRDLRQKYIDRAKSLISKRNNRGFMDLMRGAVDDFNAVLPEKDIECDKVGIVGEIYLKFHPFANKHTADWLIDRGFEVIPPKLLTFFIQVFVNMDTKKKNNTDRIPLPAPVLKLLYSVIRHKVDAYDEVMKKFRYYYPSEDVFALAEDVKDLLPLSAQFGEGWLLPAEIVSFAKQGVKAVLSLQPFGCIANHIISKGLENKIKQKYPGINILSIDFDSGVSEVNIVNRLRLLLGIFDRDENHAAATVI